MKEDASALRCGVPAFVCLGALCFNQQERFMLVYSTPSTVPIAAIEDVINVIRAGKPVLVMDDADRCCFMSG